ncbi:hypothetical protein H8B02_38045 [Bradyrhizobium sp. Pear77]|uniref:hypothetical protein n=1 Tax=Bradyrhizobium altum TaxID=1571202 RepID=UPI001E43BB11|nr:hypothetical protein [Bradyrhizobium altum]MCC8959010.1 hypothetical protein [Bradyrhizobium altum]
MKRRFDVEQLQHAARHHGPHDPLDTEHLSQRSSKVVGVAGARPRNKRVGAPGDAIDRDYIANAGQLFSDPVEQMLTAPGQQEGAHRKAKVQAVKGRRTSSRG